MKNTFKKTNKILSKGKQKLNKKEIFVMHKSCLMDFIPNPGLQFWFHKLMFKINNNKTILGFYIRLL